MMLFLVIFNGTTTQQRCKQMLAEIQPSEISFFLFFTHKARMLLKLFNVKALILLPI